MRARLAGLHPAVRFGAGLACGAGAWALAAALLPRGLPAGIVLHGAVLGSLEGLTALGLVLIWRAGRIVNFAQGEMGGLAAVVALVGVVGWGLPYGLAVPLGVAAAVGTGVLVDRVVVRRLEDSPPLILTVATVGVMQILGAIQLALPQLVANLRPLDTFHAPLRVRFHVAPLTFSGDDVLALCVVPLAGGGLAWFLRRSDYGVAVRAMADSRERALTCGLPVRRLSAVTWGLAAGLSGIGLVLASPVKGPSLGAIGGPPALLAPLAAAVLGGMRSFPRAMAAAVGLGIFQQAAFWNFPRSSVVDVLLFAVVALGLVAQRRLTAREAEAAGTQRPVVAISRPLPDALRGLRVLRLAPPLALAGAAAFACALPWLVSLPRTVLLTYVLVDGIIVASLVVLAGWAGQVSLGQFAFAGLGAAVTGSLLVHARADLLLALLAAAAAGGAAAFVVGVPALRIPGLFLAVATLAFGVPVSTFLLNSGYFPAFNPRHVPPPILLQRLSLEDPRTLYYFTLVVLAGALWVTYNLRRGRPGRVLVAVRDNEDAAAAHGIFPVRAKLFAFSASGALAGLAGGLLVVANRGIAFAGFNPLLSVQVFTAAVVGGLGSLGGALLGAGYVRAMQDLLGPAGELAATGAGLLVLLLFLPQGLGHALRELWLRGAVALAARRGIVVEAPAAAGSLELAEAPTVPPSDGPRARVGRGAAAAPGAGGPSAPPLLACRGVAAGYGHLQVLFGADLEVRRGEIVTLLGTNGAGKSTLLRVMAGVLRPWGGVVELEGRDIGRLSPAQRLQAGLVTAPGGRGVFPSLTVAENLRVASWLWRRDRAGVAERTHHALEVFPILRERLDQPAGLLSGGERQMLTLAQGLVARPRVLCVDELSLGLAPAVIARLVEVLRRLNASGVTLVVVEQSLNVAAALGQRAVFLEKGRVRFAGPVAELASRPDLARAVFLGRRAGSRAAASARNPWAGLRSPQGVPPAAPARPGEEAVFEALEVTKRFGGVAAVDGVTLAVQRGEAVGIIGPNGAGKTTLLDICTGFLRPDGGRVRLEGREVTGEEPAALALRGAGRTFQDARLWPSLTVREAIEVAADRHLEVRDPLLAAFRTWAVLRSEAAAALRVAEILELTGLQPFAETPVAELSTGTRRICELACLLAHRPGVVFSDEPTAGLAQREGEALGELVANLRRETGITLVVVEHNIPVVSALADRLVCLDAGRLIAAGPPQAVLRHPAVLEAYLGGGTDELARTRPRARSGQRRARAGRSSAWGGVEQGRATGSRKAAPRARVGPR